MTVQIIFSDNYHPLVAPLERKVRLLYKRILINNLKYYYVDF